MKSLSDLVNSDNIWSVTEPPNLWSILQKFWFSWIYFKSSISIFISSIFCLILSFLFVSLTHIFSISFSISCIFFSLEFITFSISVFLFSIVFLIPFDLESQTRDSISSIKSTQYTPFKYLRSWMSESFNSLNVFIFLDLSELQLNNSILAFVLILTQCSLIILHFRIWLSVNLRKTSYVCSSIFIHTTSSISLNLLISEIFALQMFCMSFIL